MADETILRPSEPAETPESNNYSDKNTHDVGFNIIRAIYDVFLIKKPIAFSVVQKYKNKLDIQLDAPLLYYPALVLAVIMDLSLALIVVLAISVMFVAITLSFMRGIGIFDWLPRLLGMSII